MLDNGGMEWLTRPVDDSSLRYWIAPMTPQYADNTLRMREWPCASWGEHYPDAT